MNKAIFIDRDGVINMDFGHVFKIEDFNFNENVFPALRLLQNLGFLIFIVTNQAGIAKGFYTFEDFYNLNDYMISVFKKENINITDVRFCPHHPDGKVASLAIECDCRKPKPGMINDLCAKYNINKSISYMVGDKLSDCEAGLNAKLGNLILVNNNSQRNISITNLKQYDDLYCFAKSL